MISLIRFLKGMSIVSIKRNSNMLCIVLRKNEYECSLHIQSNWRITSKESILLSSEYIYLSAKPLSEEEVAFDWDVGPSMFDEFVDEVFKKIEKRIIKKIQTNRFGDVSIFFSDKYALDIFNPYMDSGREIWRLFRRIQNKYSAHIVMYGNGNYKIE